MMDRLRSLFKKKVDRQDYEPLQDQGSLDTDSPSRHNRDHELRFSWVEYAIFTLLGVAMLWAWNMFLAAATYFQNRFQDDEWSLRNFQSAIISVSTFTNLVGMIILTNIQYTASYPFRIKLALCVNVAVFALLTLSTSAFVDATAKSYLVFLLVMVAGSAWSSALMQNGAFAFASSFGRPEYMQAIMAGQAIAGVLPPIAQIISVMAAPGHDSSSETPGLSNGDTELAAFIYFLTAVAISLLAIFAFIPLTRRHNKMLARQLLAQAVVSAHGMDEAQRISRKVVSWKTLFRKLRWLAAAVSMCFVVAMFFPVFTPNILSVSPPNEAAWLLKPAAFIPLAFFFWNLGDLSGRACALVLPCRERPVLLFGLSIGRLVFLPLYGLCNIHGRGTIVNSDVFYLLVVQFPFGLTTGWLASNCMMAAGDWVEEGEREASGGFMGLCLTAGLGVGSLLSFTAAGI